MFVVKLEAMWTALQKLKASKDPTCVQTASLSKETAWRLRQIAGQMGVSPGHVIEALIGPTVKAVRLPWDTVGRVAMGLIPASECPLESQESEGEGSVETLPIGGALTSSDEKSLMPGTGTGEGMQRPPALTAPAMGGKARPAKPAKGRQVG